MLPTLLNTTAKPDRKHHRDIISGTKPKMKACIAIILQMLRCGNDGFCGEAFSGSAVAGLEGSGLDASFSSSLFSLFGARMGAGITGTSSCSAICRQIQERQTAPGKRQHFLSL